MDNHQKYKHRRIYLCFEGHELENHLHSKEHSEDQVQSVGQLGNMVWLVTVLFTQENMLELLTGQKKKW